MTDTLTVDTALVAQLQRNPDFAYAVEQERQSLMSQLYNGFWDGLRWLLDFDVPFSDKLWTLIYIVLAVVLLVWLCTNKVFRGLFRRSERTALSIDDAERDIHAVDFDRALAAARRDGDYALACRLTYLQALKRLADAGRIAWEPSKTPTQYTYEVASADFRELTQWFLRVRYGNYVATAQTLDVMTALCDTVTKGGEP